MVKNVIKSEVVQEPVFLSQGAVCSLVVEEGEQRTLHEVLDAPSSCDQSVTTITVHDRGQLTLICSQEDDDVTVDHQYNITLGRDAKITLLIFVRGGKQCTLSFNMFLEKQGACADIYGMYLVDGERKVELSVYQHHKACATTSNVKIQGILFGQAKTNFNGTIAIAAGANNSNALLYNKNLVLSDGARAKSQPSLEVLADAVKCKHGTAVGGLDEEHMVYLRMRGFSESQAKKMLLCAFAQEVLAHVSDQSIRERWQTKVEQAV